MESIRREMINSLLLTLTACSFHAAAASKKNVLFLICDDLRPQLKVAYGQSFMHTPSFDKLANQSLVFDFAFTNMAICSASRNSFMSGRLPDNTRTWNFINNFRQGGIDTTGAVGAGWTTWPGKSCGGDSARNRIRGKPLRLSRLQLV